jgi:histidinol-phosphate/aromatic aminotransferase/cobyric acid decarboxylase-like protein
MMHGGDIYNSQGLPRPGLLDFSTTVCGSLPGLEARARQALARLQAYPQPYSRALSASLAQAYGLAPDSVLATHGSSQALRLASLALPGPALLEDPCFPGYGRVLCGHKVKRLAGPKPGLRPSLAQLIQAIPRQGSLWLANPSSPAGLVLSLASLNALWQACAVKGSVLVLDESLEAQALKPLASLLRQASSKPGLLVLRSLTKGLGMPGLRLGLATGHPDLLLCLAMHQDPWDVDSLAQALGPWLAQQSLKRRHQARAQAKASLLAQLKLLQAMGFKALPSQTGYFLLSLPKGLHAQALAERLSQQGILVRPCESFGAWGAGYLRLNPGTAKANQALAQALRQELLA